MEATSDTPARRQRRPALACEQCRKRKIKCNRQSPCESCKKAGIHLCTYASYGKPSVVTEPFRGEDTEFSVFNSALKPLSNGAGEETEDLAMTFNLDSSQLPTASPLFVTSFPVSTSYPIAPLQAHEPAFLGLLNMSIEDENLKSSSSAYSGAHIKGSRTSIEQSNSCSLMELTGSASLRGSFLRSKFLGQSHWLNFVRPNLPDILSAIEAHDSQTSVHLVTFAECESARKAIKRQELDTAQSISSTISTSFSWDDVRRLLPSQAIADRLVQAYLRTFQSVFGILYVPSFRKSYDMFWENTANADESFCMILVLVLSIGYAFTREEPTASRSMVLCWMEAASTWLISLQSNSRLDLDVLRVYILLLLSSQVLSIENRSRLLSSTSLLSVAMEMGLHVDLEVHQIPADDTECRRRLWAAILELHVQSCMDLGRVPLISPEDYDCALPSNIDDAALELLQSSSMAIHGTSKPIEDFTQSSIQILLVKALGVRLKIARFINSFRTNNLSFEEALSLDAELASCIKASHSLIRTYNMSSMQPTKFQTEFFNLVVQKSLLGLHLPFAMDAISNPSHSYSRYTCLNTSLAILSERDKYGRQDCLAFRGAGLFYDIYSKCALYLCSELAHYYQNTCEVEFPDVAITFARRNEMHYAVEQYLDLAKAYIRTGIADFEDYLIVACLAARVEAIRDHVPISTKVVAAVKTTLESCHSSFIAAQESLRSLTDFHIAMTLPTVQSNPTTYFGR